MKIFSFLWGFTVFLASASAQQPVINADGVTNSASYMPSGLPSSGIAQGSLFLVFGSNLGPAALQQVASFPLPTVFGGTSVKVTVGGTSVDAIMVYTSAGQVAAILPSNTPTGSGTLTLTYNNQTSAPVPITVVKSSFGIYTLNQGGTGPAVVTTASYTANTLTSVARPGDTLIIWGTGLGAVPGNEAAAPATVADLPLDVKVFVGNKAAAISYKGRSNCCAALDQINFVVPAGVEGCYVPLEVTVGGVPSNFASIAIASQGNVCSDPAGIPSAAIAKLAAGGSLKVGFIELQRISADFAVPILGSVNLKQDKGAAYFYNFDSRALIASRGITSISAFGSCNVLVCRGSTCIPDNDALNVSRLDAGSAITITGSNGGKPLPKVKTGEYRADLANSTSAGGMPLNIPGLPNDKPFLDAGSYTASGVGGADVGAFTANLTVPAPLVWTNRPTGAIDRSQDLSLTWTGGGVNDYVAAVATSTSATADVTSTAICTEKASAGKLVIPSNVLQALPASGIITQAGFQFPAGFLLLGNYPLSNTFNAPGLDLGFFTQAIVEGKNAQFQ